MTEPLIIEKLESLPSDFSNFRVKMWLDKKEEITLYVVFPLRNGTDVDEARYEYDEVLFCRYSLNKNRLFVMLRDLNSKGYFKEDFFVNKDFIGILDIDDFEKLDPGNIDFKSPENIR